MSEPPRQEDGPPLSLVLGALAALSIVFGVAAYKRYADSERWVAEGIQEMDRVGAELEIEPCLDKAMEWAEGCEAQGTNQAVCLHAVKMLMFHCLDARDRGEECEPFTTPADDGKWVYAACAERGSECKQKRECSCAEGYRAIDSYCRVGAREAVQM